MNRKPTLGITIGDPAGIGPEITLKALMTPKLHNLANLLAIGNAALLHEQARDLGLAAEISSEAPFTTSEYVAVHDVPEPPQGSWAYGQINAACGRASSAYLQTAVALVKRGIIDGIVTGPLNKEAWKAAAVPFPGHTEALGELFEAHVETMFVVDKLRIFFLTRHVSLRQAVELVNSERLLALLRHAHLVLQNLGISQPQIAVAGLNPHGGEHGLFGDEEETELKPGILAAVSEGINAIGPIPADSVFHQAAEGRYDAVIALYHDQGHIAAKMHDFYRTVSVTTGLPVIRTSVDHGTAFDIAGKGIADPTSMHEAIRVAVEFVSHARQQSNEVKVEHHS